jgi:hypothetical protein
MHYGFPPFFDSNKDKLFKKIMFSEVDFRINKDVQICAEAKDLILKLLDKNQKIRIKINNVKKHPYFDKFDFDSLLNKTMKPPLIMNIDPDYNFNEKSYSSTQDCKSDSNPSTGSYEKKQEYNDI